MPVDTGPVPCNEQFPLGPAAVRFFDELPSLQELRTVQVAPRCCELAGAQRCRETKRQCQAALAGPGACWPDTITGQWGRGLADWGLSGA